MACTALDKFTAEPRPKALYIVAASFDLALAHLARGDLDAVSKHLVPVLRATGAEYRSVPGIGRARSLNTLLGPAARPRLQYPASNTLAALRDDLSEFCTPSAPAPAGVEPGSTT
ncbi:MAG: hypothetical protein ACRDQ9_11990 [Pseudonocardiaceae bacterium]